MTKEPLIKTIHTSMTNTSYSIRKGRINILATTLIEVKLAINHYSVINKCYLFILHECGFQVPILLWCLVLRRQTPKLILQLIPLWHTQRASDTYSSQRCQSDLGSVGLYDLSYIFKIILILLSLGLKQEVLGLIDYDYFVHFVCCLRRLSVIIWIGNRGNF